MVNHKEILRLKSLGLTHCEIADAAGCGRNTVTRTLARAREQKLNWQQVQSLSQQEVTQRLFPTEQTGPVYKMPDYEWVHREMQKSGVTLSLLWVEYCEQCRQAGELPYKSTQLNKYYADYVHKTKATMHLAHKPGETMQVDWAGQTAALVDTDTGDRLEAYLFVAVLPYSGYAYAEAYEAGVLDYRSRQRLPVFWWCHPHPYARQPQGRSTQKLTDRNCSQQILPGNGRALWDCYSSGQAPQSQGQSLCGGLGGRGLYLDSGRPAQLAVPLPARAESSHSRKTGGPQP